MDGCDVAGSLHLSDWWVKVATVREHTLHSPAQNTTCCHHMSFVLSILPLRVNRHQPSFLQPSLNYMKASTQSFLIKNIDFDVYRGRRIYSRHNWAEIWRLQFSSIWLRLHSMLNFLHFRDYNFFEWKSSQNPHQGAVHLSLASLICI